MLGLSRLGAGAQEVGCGPAFLAQGVRACGGPRPQGEEVLAAQGDVSTSVPSCLWEGQIFRHATPAGRENDGGTGAHQAEADASFCPVDRGWSSGSVPAMPTCASCLTALNLSFLFWKRRR